MQSQSSAHHLLPLQGAIFEPRKCLSLWRNPSVHITKNKPAVCFWEDFPGLTSHFKPEGPQHRGESVRELSPADRDDNRAVFYRRGRPSAATVGAGKKRATAVEISWVLDPRCFAYRCRHEAAVISVLHVFLQKIPVFM